MKHYDLIIVGGGLVGASLALALRNAPLKIAIIDAKDSKAPDPRLYGLNATSCEFLKNLRLWPNLASHAAPIHQVEVSQRGLFGAVRLNRDDINIDALGHVIPAAVLENALDEALKHLTHIDFYRPATLKNLHEENGSAQLTILYQDSELRLSTPLVIGADGTHSTVRSLTKLNATVVDYKQTAIVTRTSLNRFHHAIAYERFTSDGAVAMLPLIGNECATIWTTKETFANELLALSAADFVQALQAKFGYRLGRFKQISERFAFPLRGVDVPTIHKGCIYLLGNAAHTLHPIAAQGLNLAIYEVALLAEVLLKTPAKSTYNWDLLSQQMSKQKNISTQLSHRLAQLFASPSIAVSTFLQVGMVGLDSSLLMKRKFINHVLGKEGYAPSLLQNGMHYDKTIPPDD